MASDAMTSQQSPVLEDHDAGPFYGSTDSRDVHLAFTRQVSGQKRDWRSNSLNCPTCNGTGRIGSERANELVALIPCSDKRLKPRRLTFYIIISIVACMVLCSLIVFFIYPRTICISELSVNNSTAWTKSNSSVSLNFTLQGTIHNGNFYSIKVSNITYEASFFTSVVSTTDKNNFTIPTRSSHKVSSSVIIPTL
uniref:Transmembrane protein 106B n=1 Tax=Eptatretus burgeri TaxID=7764 RepID=A0A8C4RAF9_EPTBU